MQFISSHVDSSCSSACCLLMFKLHCRNKDQGAELVIHPDSGRQAGRQVVSTRSPVSSRALAGDLRMDLGLTEKNLLRHPATPDLGECRSSLVFTWKCSVECLTTSRIRPRHRHRRWMCGGQCRGKWYATINPQKANEKNTAMRGSTFHLPATCIS